MEHVVFFPGPDGAPSFRRFASLEESVLFVEHLRNAEDVSEVSVHALTPVPVAFRAYYKVEMPVAEAPPSLVAEAPVLAEVPMQAAEPTEVAELPQPTEVPVLAEVAGDAESALVPVTSSDAEPASNGKRSLGFFAH